MLACARTHTHTCTHTHTYTPAAAPPPLLHLHCWAEVGVLVLAEGFHAAACAFKGQPALHGDKVTYVFQGSKHGSSKARKERSLACWV
eukprot:1136509-Pelagomonas_calceolata.AAC.1